MFKTNFLIDEQVRQLVREHGTPLYVYSRTKIIEQCRTMLNIPAPYGLTVRYAMKANPNADILRLVREHGLKLDASSGFEVTEAMEAGFLPSEILLTTQQLPKNLKELVELGVEFDASSLHQLKTYGELFPGTEVSLRINPGFGSGFSSHVLVGGPTSSFGIWHEYVPEVQQLLKQYNLKVKRMLTHIGSGADPNAWLEAARKSLELIKHFPDATVLDIGGGFKAARMDDERGVDMDEVGHVLERELTEFARATGRQLGLEVEPGMFIVANSALLVARVGDIVDTGAGGYRFIKLDTGMNDLIRPAMYGAQHPIAVLSGTGEEEEYVVVGHNCESADIFTTVPGNPHEIQPRRLKQAHIGDIVLIGGVGGYGPRFSVTGYNSFPSAVEIFT